jgi:AAA family ATP:ADP antiporter
MADVFDDDQAKRLFGVIAAGGTTGAIIGPMVAGSFVLWFGTNSLLLISAALLATTLVCIRKISRWSSFNEALPREAIHHQEPVRDAVLGGSVWGGIKRVLSSYYLMGIAALMLLFTTLSTFLYFQQAQIISDSFIDPAHRTAVFAGMDLAVNGLTLILQLLVTGRLIRRFGLPWMLALVPVLLCAGFLALSLMPVLGVIVVVQVLRRAGNYAITRPGREMLYVVLDRESKYKAKNVNDTVMYRGGDALSAWVYAGLRGLGLSLSQIALIAVPLAALWAGLAYALGRQQEKLSAEQQKCTD